MTNADKQQAADTLLVAELTYQQAHKKHLRYHSGLTLRVLQDARVQLEQAEAHVASLLEQAGARVGTKSPDST